MLLVLSFSDTLKQLLQKSEYDGRKQDETRIRKREGKKMDHEARTGRKKKLEIKKRQYRRDYFIILRTKVFLFYI